MELSDTRTGSMIGVPADGVVGGREKMARTLSIFAPGDNVPLWHDVDKSAAALARRLCTKFEGEPPRLYQGRIAHPCG